MLYSWIKQFIRVSVKGKFYTIVNTIGLAIGLMSMIIILLWTNYLKSYDKFHPDFQKIFLVYKIQSNANGYNHYLYTTPAPLAGFLKETFPDINNTTRFTNCSAVLGMGEKPFRENKLGFTDSTFFNIFKVEFISGNKKQCFKEINSIVITEELASKLFGSTDVVGKSIRINGKIELTVTAVIKNYPKNSIIGFSCLIPFEKISEFGFEGLNSWGWNSYWTFLKVENISNIGDLEKRINAETIKQALISKTVSFNLFPIEKAALYNPNPNASSTMFFVTLLGSIAGFVLLLACINFINLITARATNRAKEVGIRKVIGSSKIQLVAQYFMETFLSTLLSLFIAILLVDIALPSFNESLNADLKLCLTDFLFWYKIIILVIVVGFVSGIYPALVLSSFQPAKVLKGILRSGSQGAVFRKTMVIFQYTLTIFLIILTFYLFKQLNFISNVDTGMSRKNVISIPFRKDMESNYINFKNELRKIPAIKYVTGSQHMPFNISSSTDGFSWSGKDTTQVYRFSITSSDESLADVMEIKMAEGRFYSLEYPSDTSSIVINETAAKVIDKKPILGELVTSGGHNFKIIGVMKDFYFKHFTQKMEPLFIKYKKNGFNFMLIKAQNSFDLQTMNQIKKTFADFYPEY
ncbi:MAG: ABC transporter permease, partial [Bacteroidales bacterium]